MQVKSYIKKEKKSEISNLSFYLKRLEEKRKSNSRDEEGNDKMAAKSNDTGKRKTIDQKKKKKKSMKPEVAFLRSKKPMTCN